MPPSTPFSLSLLTILALLTSGALSITITIVNECNHTVWPGFFSKAGGLPTTGFPLQKGESNILTASPSWAGRIWGRTLCSVNSTGEFSCVTGDCGSGLIECSGSGSLPPATLAEFNLDVNGGLDFFDVSLVDGYNLPMLVVPQGGNGTDCTNTGCVGDVKAVCPPELKVTSDDGSSDVVACKSACAAFNEPQYCCTPPYGTPNTCNPYNYSKIFKDACPKAYSYPFDDSATRSCANANYTITFCPPSNTSDCDGGCPVHASHKWIGIASAIAASLLALVLCSVWYLIHKRKLAVENQRKIQDTLNMMNSNRPANANGLQSDGKREHDITVFKYSSIIAATCNFSDESKLGEGGFGSVYKGKLVTGQVVAVKRLSKCSGQGLSEFKNELILIYELQHKSLVQLFGFCIHGEERMLVYEYMPNKSLDYFLFDSTRCQQLDWKKRFGIIEGVAQGMLYLHTYSRLRIIHRDLKASNVLLDESMNPKISDFGMARIFAHDQLEAKTMKIVGTRGYMPPEYVMGGNFSIKSDVYSFGVLMLEILSGRRNNSFYNDDSAINLVGYAWALWKEGAGLGLMDPTLGDSCDKDQLLRSIHVGLLCVEENAASRPTMIDVIYMLTNKSLALPAPTKPAFCTERNVIMAAVGGNGAEIVASVNGGKAIASSSNNDDRVLNIVGFAWELWKEGAGLKMLDPSMGDLCNEGQLLRCTYVALLCVEENAANRPAMSDVISSLTSESMPLAVPTKPAFYTVSKLVETDTSGIDESEV